MLMLMLMLILIRISHRSRHRTSSPIHIHNTTTLLPEQPWARVTVSASIGLGNPRTSAARWSTDQRASTTPRGEATVVALWGRQAARMVIPSKFLQTGQKVRQTDANLTGADTAAAARRRFLVRSTPTKAPTALSRSLSARNQGCLLGSISSCIILRGRRRLRLRLRLFPSPWPCRSQCPSRLRRRGTIFIFASSL